MKKNVIQSYVEKVIGGDVINIKDISVTSKMQQYSNKVYGTSLFITEKRGQFFIAKSAEQIVV